MNEKENTARILREERPLVTGFFCRFSLHTWTKWSKPQQSGIYEVQERYCGHCGIVSSRKVLET